MISNAILQTRQLTKSFWYGLTLSGSFVILELGELPPHEPSPTPASPNPEKRAEIESLAFVFVLVHGL